MMIDARGCAVDGYWTENDVLLAKSRPKSIIFHNITFIFRFLENADKCIHETAT